MRSWTSKETRRSLLEATESKERSCKEEEDGWANAPSGRSLMLVF